MAEDRNVAPLHPGEILYRDFLVRRGISINRMSLDLRVPLNRIQEIVKCRRAVSPDTALRFARYLGTTAAYWLNLQSDYDLQKAADESAERIEREVIVNVTPASRDRSITHTSN